jgi:hypothetical protein
MVADLLERGEQREHQAGALDAAAGDGLIVSRTTAA